MVIDLHSHYFPLESLAGFPNDLVNATTAPDGSVSLTVNGHHLPLDRRLFDIEQQLADMRSQDLTGKALMVPPFTFQYELPPEVGVRWAAAINDGIAREVTDHPGVFFGFATLPLQDVPAAVAELDRAIGTLGLVGVEIATSINGLPLDDETLLPFWTRCQELDIPVLIHPHYVAGAGRMGHYHLRNLIGNPAETALAGATLLFGGILERLPNLRIVLSHGGGALPHLVGRLRQGFATRPECQVHTTDPIGQLARFYVDTIVFDPHILAHITELLGADRLVVGTDYPFDMSEAAPVGFLHTAGLPDGDIATIVATTAALVATAQNPSHRS